MKLSEEIHSSYLLHVLEQELFIRILTLLLAVNAKQYIFSVYQLCCLLYYTQVGWSNWNFGTCCWNEGGKAWDSKSWCRWWEEEIGWVIKRSRQSSEQKDQITREPPWCQLSYCKQWWRCRGMMRMFIDSEMNIMYYRSYLCVKRKKKQKEKGGGGWSDSVEWNNCRVGISVVLLFHRLYWLKVILFCNPLLK